MIYTYDDTIMATRVVVQRSHYGSCDDYSWNIPCSAAEAIDCVKEAIEKTGVVCIRNDLRYRDVASGRGNVYCYPGIKVTWDADNAELNHELLHLLNKEGIPAMGVIINTTNLSVGARRGDIDAYLVGWVEE
jgi:hypothetical protein